MVEPPAEEDVDAHVAAMVEAAFETKSAIAELTREYFEDAASGETIQRVLDQRWAERLQRQQKWSGDGDYARLSAAFEDLSGRGIVARMNFTCCQSCGHAEIVDEKTTGEERGYVFFHQQDSERLADRPAVLFLAYGSFSALGDFTAERSPDLWALADGGDQEARRQIVLGSEEVVAGEVVEALRRQGVQVQWVPGQGQRIAVNVTEWDKPLPV
ncbi:hypothetical protein [Aeromicrobium sp. NPDC092404]|uniref:DUF6891 domain-containing protein n=1 Tax=Aeromicrobium sp. NPDC092404 TaxID=3154976 RepID=UPI00344ABD50